MAAASPMAPALETIKRLLFKTVLEFVPPLAIGKTPLTSPG